jgi:hypothetical protein
MASSDDEPPPLVPDKVFRQGKDACASLGCGVGWEKVLMQPTRHFCLRDTFVCTAAPSSQASQPARSTTNARQQQQQSKEAD